MSFLVLRGFFILVCVWMLASQPYIACGLRTKDLVQISHVLKGDAMEGLESKMDLAPSPSMTFDANQSNKRTVKKGSNPIHNRS
ncbi:hypothetical protein MtrunA17_Chr3g0092351 [Medicago truncatula]|uniref:Clavata3/ESR (CLE) gene family member MtCLE11 n=1 Tax=Medicago truncatula TaxID=3880 RepID=A0A072UV28_MEDTR|nr:Clavata3/ESR (CLE) gene family member MtCLE11 [Medicago truncatula]RHN66553.1 hypothetical protein MtrunA17_Chr3g0092351 [Medicago truncatula]